MMKGLIFFSMLSTCAAFADSTQVVCSEGDNASVAQAVADLNLKLKRLNPKVTSAPVITYSRLGYVTVCVTVTK